MVLKKNDFIEIEFTAKVKDGEVFDSNIKEDLKKAKLDIEPKPLIFSLGNGMFLKGIDDFLVGKPEPMNPISYEIELPPEKAFGFRDSKLIQLIPMKVFRAQNINPVPGVIFNFDGRIAKILSVSGGRVIADFNNPVAGKNVVYKINVLRKVEEIKEKAKAFIDFLFRRDLNFEIKDNKIILSVEKNLVQFVELFKDKFKEVLDLDLEVKEEEKSENKDKKKLGKKEEKNSEKKEKPKEQNEETQEKKSTD